MKLATVATAEAGGMTLAHAAVGAQGRIGKGTVLEEDHLASLAEAGVAQLAVAVFDENDLGENEAARRIAAAVAGAGVQTAKAASGRVNVFAATAGLLRVSQSSIDRCNEVDPAVTIATLQDREHVEAGRLVASVKIIPFAVAEAAVRECEEIGAGLEVKSYKPAKAALIQTRLPAVKEAVLDKTKRVTANRLAKMNATIAAELRCAHDVEELAEAIGEARAQKPDLLLLSGASAVCDERDVLPEAIKKCGGSVVQVGMPVDPGNLLVLGEIDGIHVVGLPGCARSPKLNGVDWVLQRLQAGERVDAQAIQRMGVGGLLDEIHERPGRRVPAPADGGVAAVLLAAGLSSRMGERNKLLENWNGRPLLEHAAQALRAALEQKKIARVVAVTGHDSQLVAKLLDGYGFELVHNDKHESGMASSLQKGVAALPADTAGALVCLGDMPQVTAELLGKVVEAFNPSEGKDIVAPLCGSKRGHPVLFGKRHFAAIAALEGDVGARSIVSGNEQAVVDVEAGPETLLDLDDPQSFQEA